MWLTGRADGPPRLAPGRPAALLQDELRVLGAALADRLPAGSPAPVLPGVELLGERAAHGGLSRNAPFSPGGKFAIYPTRDGWIGLSLARQSDLDLVPALVSSDRIEDPWRAVARWARGTTTDEAAARVALLALPGGAVPVPGRTAAWTGTDSVAEPVRAGDHRPPVVRTPGGRRRSTGARPLVVDFSSLWAGPLCAHLLGVGGAEVVKVESRARLDGARRGAREFYDLLHHGHACVAADFTNATDRAALRRLTERADVVIEASRPRALRRLGIDAEDHVAAGAVWVSLTAAGRDSDAVGFGDDIAAGAGLVVADSGGLIGCGDALADPLSGVVAARHAAQALLGEHGMLLDVSMHEVCRTAAVPGSATGNAGHDSPAAVVTRDHRGRWWLEEATGRVPVARPTGRRAPGRAPGPGADDARMLR